MKKIFFAAIPILAAVLLTTSCKNDDIVITQVGSKHDVILNISTKNMYDEFNIANRIRDNYLRDGNNVIGVITYVYDSEGNLVKSQMDYQNNFNNVTQTFINLVEGEYTFITIETLLNSDIDYQAENWSFDDIEKLSTLKITQKYSIVYLGAVLGVVTTNVSLTGNQSVNIIPKAIGSLVNFHPFKFENSEFVKVGFCTTDVVEFYSLNPQLQRNEKIHMNLEKKGFINPRFECDKEDATGELYWTVYLLDSSVEYMNYVQDETDVNNNQVTCHSQLDRDLEDGKTYEAGFYYLYSDEESPYVSSYFGGISGFEKWLEECEGYVPSPSFIKPYVDWTIGTVSAVKSYMSRYILYQDVQYDEDLKSYNMSYFNNSYTAMYLYSFTSLTSGLTDAYVYLDGDTYSLDKVREKVELQGYTYNSSSNNNYYYTSDDTYVTVYLSDSGMIMLNYYNPKAYGLAPKYDFPMCEFEKIHNVFSTEQYCQVKFDKIVDKANIPIIRIDNRRQEKALFK